ncbi:MAG: pyridoxal phosphate-dependent aminotransferase [Candidatus Cloacimonetes bacterium]|nr:pyridoxal phosphate-dependent aminotransferase [Candidatus Cloacimonadota bacterium]
MAIKLANRARAIKPSPTLSVMQKAKALQAQGLDVVNFGVGEPDFDTPDYIKEAGKKAIDDNFTHYTAANGIPDLRRAVADKLKRDNDLDYSPDDILICPGAKTAIMQMLMTVCDMRDQVMIPTPYWVSYISQVELVDSLPLMLPTSIKTGFKITPEQLEEAILTNSTPKVLILNSPNNPTGVVYTRAELEAIAQVCLEHDIIIISDEIYEKLIYDGEEHVSIASISPEVKDISIVINGVSKAYAMTGWRVGYAAGPREIIQRAGRIQGHLTSCVNSIAQKAAVTALTEDDGTIEVMRQEFEQRRNYLIDRLNKIKNVSSYLPKGAFYCMPNISYYLFNNRRGITNSVELCEYLIENYRVAVVPGLAFGVNRYVRFSYASGMDQIKEGLKRFEEGLYSLL